MTLFARTVASAVGVPEARLDRLAAGSLSEVLLVRWPDGRRSVAKNGAALSSEAAMLRALAAAGAPAPAVEAEHDDVLLLEYVENDGMFSARAWADAGRRLGALHARLGSAYGWPTDHSLGTVAMDNRRREDWPGFWGEQRLMATVALMDRPWRRRVERVCSRLDGLLPARPAPALLHGDLWSGNMLVRRGRLVALIDPACYHGDAEVDLAMLDLFGAPPAEFQEAYGPLEPGWRERRAIYQLYPALVHVRLWGESYQPLLDRLLAGLGE